MKTLAEVIAGHSVVICAGCGGVGKTTIAAALALHGAAQGRRTVVLTIDPARRLADALGLATLGNVPRRVRTDAPGPLFAMMLDQKAAWDQLIKRYAPSAEVAQRILANRFYQHLSESFAGSQEYMAVEQLAHLAASAEYDLIVVDTPPAQHALEFLDAPRRIADFLDRQIIRWFVKPYFAAGWTTLQALNRGASSFLKRLEDATGVAALMEVSEFFTSMSALFEGFEARVRSVYSLFRSPRTAFVLVATPEEQVLEEAFSFCRKVGQLEVPLRAVVFNRVHEGASLTSSSLDPAKLRRVVSSVIGPALRADSIVENFLRFDVLARGDHLRIAAFRKRLTGRPAVAMVPNFAEDLHAIGDLKKMLPHLVGDAR